MQAFASVKYEPKSHPRILDASRTKAHEQIIFPPSQRGIKKIVFTTL